MDIVEEIKKHKNKINAVILAHNYERPEIQDIADMLGDSLGLSREASSVEAEVIVFCGVSFMAESAKILSPRKTVLLPRKNAGCALADKISAEEVIELKKKHPGVPVVSYVNTSAEVKAESDVCCTSSNAVNVVKNLSSDRVIFIPDRNLAYYVQKNVDKEIIPWDGYCYVHESILPEDINFMREKYPEAVILVHPECRPEVIDSADEVLSTGGMVRYVKSSDRKEFVIGTEEGIIYRLERENPDKDFYSLGVRRICYDMKRTKIEDVLNSLKRKEFNVELRPEVIKKAGQALEAMLEYA